MFPCHELVKKKGIMMSFSETVLNIWTFLSNFGFYLTLSLNVVLYNPSITYSDIELKSVNFLVMKNKSY